MHWWAVAVIASAAVPLAAAWRANRGWTIRHALVWSGFAWLSWLGFAAFPCSETAYAALSLTGATGVAVLGARRPGVVAWNFIVASLLIVLWLGWAEGLVSGSGLKLSTLRLLFIAGLLAATLFNYFPTPSWPAALLLGIGCGVSLMALWNKAAEWTSTHAIMVGCSCWLDWLLRKLLRTVPNRSEFDWHWLSFRNRYGAVWSERVREQFNATAKNKQWPVHLRWRGISGENNTEVQAECTAALQALIKRFGNSGERA